MLTRPTVAVTVEVLFLSPIALCILAYYHGWTGHFGGDGWTSFLPTLSGPSDGNALDFILLCCASDQIVDSGHGSISTQASNSFARHWSWSNRSTCGHAIAFPMIWFALVIYSVVSSLFETRLNNVQRIFRCVYNIKNTILMWYQQSLRK